MLRQIKRAIDVINELNMMVKLNNLNVGNLLVSDIPVVRWWRATTEDEFFEALDKLEPFDGIIVYPKGLSSFLTITMDNQTINKNFPYTIVSYLTTFNMNNSSFILSIGTRLIGLIINATGSTPIQAPVTSTVGPPPEIIGVSVSVSLATPGYGILAGYARIKDSQIIAPIPLAIGTSFVERCSLGIFSTGPGIMISPNFGNTGLWLPRVVASRIENMAPGGIVNGIEVYSFKKAIVEENEILDVTGTGILLTGTSTEPSEFTIVFKNKVSPGVNNRTASYGVRETSNTDSNIIVGNILKATTPISTTSTTTITDDNIT